MLFPRFLFTFLLVFTITFDAVFAIPLPGGSDPLPKMPSVQELMKKHLRVKKNKTLFYAGVTEATRLEYQKSSGLETMRESWRDQNYRVPWKLAEESVRVQFFDRASEALARMAKGKVYVLLLEGAPDSGPPGSAWNVYEWPNLQREGIEVIRLNVDSSGKVTGRVTIWPRGR